MTIEIERDDEATIAAGAREAPARGAVFPEVLIDALWDFGESDLVYAWLHAHVAAREGAAGARALEARFTRARAAAVRAVDRWIEGRLETDALAATLTETARICRAASARYGRS